MNLRHWWVPIAAYAAAQLLGQVAVASPDSPAPDLSDELKRELNFDTRLSNVGPSAAPTFTVAAQVSHATDAGGLMVAAQASPTTAAVLYATVLGRPLVYVYGDQSVELDGSGGFIVRKHAVAEYRLTSDHERFVTQLDLTSPGPTGRSVIETDPGGVIRAAMEHGGRVGRASESVYSVATPHARFAVQALSVPGNQRLDRLLFVAYHRGDSLIRQSTGVSQVGDAVRFAEVTVEQLRATGLPVRVLDGPPIDRDGTPASPGIIIRSATLWSDPRNVLAAERLSRLVPAQTMMANMLASYGHHATFTQVYTLYDDNDPNAFASAKKIGESHSAAIDEARLAFLAGRLTAEAFRATVLDQVELGPDLAKSIPIDRFVQFAYWWLGTNTMLDTYETQHFRRYLSSLIGSAIDARLPRGHVAALASACIRRAAEAQTCGQAYLAGEISNDVYMAEFAAGGPRVKAVDADLANILPAADLASLKAQAGANLFEKLHSEP